jgi:hypothetical protein
MSAVVPVIFLLGWPIAIVRPFRSAPNAAGRLIQDASRSFDNLVSAV